MMSSEDETYGVGRRMRESLPEQPGRSRPPECEAAPADPEGRRREITVIERDRILAQLQDKVIQRVCRAALNLEAAAEITTDPAAGRLIGAATDELDHVVQEIRSAVFGHEQRTDGRGLREQIIDLSSRLVTAADISFAGPPDGTLDAATSAQLLENLRQALALIGEYATPARIDIAAGDTAHDIVIEAALLGPGTGEAGQRFASLRARAAQAGIPVEIEHVPGGTRFTWHARITPSAQER
jgi:signal transduction histidine kinase